MTVPRIDPKVVNKVGGALSLALGGKTDGEIVSGLNGAKRLLAGLGLTERHLVEAAVTGLLALGAVPEPTRPMPRSWRAVFSACARGSDRVNAWEREFLGSLAKRAADPMWVPSNKQKDSLARIYAKLAEVGHV